VVDVLRYPLRWLGGGASARARAPTDRRAAVGRRRLGTAGPRWSRLGRWLLALRAAPSLAPRGTRRRRRHRGCGRKACRRPSVPRAARRRRSRPGRAPSSRPRRRSSGEHGGWANPAAIDREARRPVTSVPTWRVIVAGRDAPRARLPAGYRGPQGCVTSDVLGEPLTPHQRRRPAGARRRDAAGCG